MQKWIALLCVLALSMGLGALAVSQEPTSDEAALKMLADKWAEAWNSGQVEAIGELYIPDADFVGIDGKAVKGREGIVKSYVDLVSAAYEGSQLSIEMTNVRFIKPDLAVIDDTWEITGVAPAEEGQPPPTKGSATLVAVKQDGDWLVAAHRVRVPPAAPAPGQN